MTGLRVELVSEHASPLATVGEPDAGGQNVHVAALATQLAALGCQVTVATRAAAPDLADRARAAGAAVADITADTPAEIAADIAAQRLAAIAGQRQGG